MLFQFSLPHDNGQSMVISIMYESCSVSCHHLMTTVRAWLYIIYLLNMPCKLSSANDNGHNMVMYSSGMKHAPSAVIVS